MHHNRWPIETRLLGAILPLILGVMCCSCYGFCALSNRLYAQLFPHLLRDRSDFCAMHYEVVRERKLGFPHSASDLDSVPLKVKVKHLKYIIKKKYIYIYI